MYRQENRTIKTVEGPGSPVAGVSISVNSQEEGRPESGTLAVTLRMNQNYTITAEKDGYRPVVIEQMFSLR